MYIYIYTYIPASSLNSPLSAKYMAEENTMQPMEEEIGRVYEIEFRGERERKERGEEGERRGRREESLPIATMKSIMMSG
jgi:hypothetical protein